MDNNERRREKEKTKKYRERKIENTVLETTLV